MIGSGVSSPARSTRPSGWTTIAERPASPAELELSVVGTTAVPPVPKFGSRTPAAVTWTTVKSATPDSPPTYAPPSAAGAKMLEDELPGSATTPPEPKVGSGVPSGSNRARERGLEKSLGPTKARTRPSGTTASPDTAPNV